MNDLLEFVKWLEKTHKVAFEYNWEIPDSSALIMEFCKNRLRKEVRSIDTSKTGSGIQTVPYIK